MNRPGGVTVIAVLYWLGAFILAILACIMLVGSATIGAMASSALGTAFAGLGTIGAIVVLGLAAVVAFIGVGVFQLKEWARITAIVFAALGILFGLLGFFSPAGMFLFGRLVRIAINAWVIWYLLQPQVRAAYAATR